MRGKSLVPEFVTILEQAVFLRPYATLFRYPAGELLPPRNDVEAAIVCAREILDFVKGLLEE
jgi:hypothetical protein